MSLSRRELLGPTLALFASVTTLLCCALPALLIVLGAGAVLGGLAANVPGLIWLSAHKEWVFAVAGLLLVIAAVAKWRGRNAPCPADPTLAEACTRLRRWGTILLVVAGVLYVVGAFFAFFAADVLL